MKRIIIFILFISLSYFSQGQHNFDNKFSEINLEDFVPSDFDEFWLYQDGSGAPILRDAYSYMDTFRFFFRKPFSQYLLGEYYYGYIVNIDSITTKTPFINESNDSICYVYALFNVIEQYYSPYNKEIYYSPIPSDIMNDSAENFRYYRSLQKQAEESTQKITNVCVMMTKNEVKEMEGKGFVISAKEILLRVDKDNDQDSTSIVFCSQPFFEGYSTELILTKAQIAKYKIFVYRRLYYDLYKKDLVDY